MFGNYVCIGLHVVLILSSHSAPTDRPTGGPQVGWELERGGGGEEEEGKRGKSLLHFVCLWWQNHVLIKFQCVHLLPRAEHVDENGRGKRQWTSSCTRTRRLLSQRLSPL